MSSPDPGSECFDLARIRNFAGVNRLHFMSSMTSTSDVAKSMLVHESPDLPLLVLTSRQTAGRGQPGRSWWAGQGALTFSWVPNSDLPADPAILSLGAAVAVATAIDMLDTSLHPEIKWPNDVLVGRKKIAGILIESLVVGGSRNVIFGVGVNANNSMENAPSGFKAGATSLFETLGRQVDLNHLLAAIVVQLQQVVQNAGLEPGKIIQSCLDRSPWRIGDPIAADTSTGIIRGQFAGFGPSGQLLIEKPGSIESIVSGSVVEF